MSTSSEAAFSVTNDQCLDLEQVLSHEWLETNGLGGYASSTLYECHTRKYHGLLVCSLAQPEGKFVLLSKLETELVVRQAGFDFNLNKYPGVYYPSGHNYVEQISCGIHPKTIYRLGDIRLERSIMVPRGENVVLVRYELLSASEDVLLCLRPLLAYRDFHTTIRANHAINGSTRKEANGFSITPYVGMPTLYVTADRARQWTEQGNWYYNLEYIEEQERGLDYQEDLFCPGILSIDLQLGEAVIVRASIDEAREQPSVTWERELRRREQALKRYASDDALLRMLKARSESLIIRNPRQEMSIVAGYHWFAEWGRDTMIALPGLTLACARNEEAMQILTSYGKHVRGGLIPNYLATAGDNHAYNSVDASLWYVWATQMYLRYTNDRDGVEANLLNGVGRILRAFAEGSVQFVVPQENGLISVGNEHTQLTWMDALVNGRPVTPRHGLAVELNALWYNALCFYLEFTDEKDRRLVEIRDAAKAAFMPTFWLPDRQYLADCVRPEGPDISVRPNQIFAVSLPHSPLDDNAMRGVVRRVRDDLVTPFGLRTLSPDHPDYVGWYEGDPAQRDSSYHQGTVWPWLVGHYVEAALRIASHPATVAEGLWDCFEPLFQQHPREAGLFCVSEIFDAEPPHRPNGAIQQAWSVAEIIRTQQLLHDAMTASS